MRATFSDHVVTETGRADAFFHLLRWNSSVPGMVRLFVGIVASRIVTTDHRPARLIGGVSRGMKKIAVEEEHIAGIHLSGNARG